MAVDENTKKEAHFTIDDLIALRMVADNFKRMERTLEDMNRKLETSFVTKNEMVPFIKRVEEELVERKEFAPIQKIVYGMTGLLMTTVFLAILSLVVTK
jgi:hypothetical protein